MNRGTFVDTDKTFRYGSTRESFVVSLDQAVDIILYYRKDLFNGEPIYY